MILSASEIERAHGRGDLVIDPFERDCLKPASYVLRLGDRYAAPLKGGTIDVGKPEASSVSLDLQQGDTWDLPPGGFVLGCTLEAIGCGPHLVGFLSDLSHHGRVGLGVHGGSLLVSPGFGLREPTPLTLELSNRSGSTLRLRSGLPIAHLVFARVEGDTLLDQLPLGRSAYEGSDAPSGSRFEPAWGALLPSAPHDHGAVGLPYPLPDFLCVPAFVAGALRALGEPQPDIVALARELGVVVPLDAPNPLGLPTTDEPYLAGLTPERADRAINAWIQAHDLPLRFRYVPENTVSFRDYRSLVEDVQARGGVVGVGFDYRVLSGQKNPSRHVARLAPAAADSVVLLDDSQSHRPEPHLVPWPRIEFAMSEVRGGFWLLGPEAALRTSFALPWPLPTSSSSSIS